ASASSEIHRGCRPSNLPRIHSARRCRAEPRAPVDLRGRLRVGAVRVSSRSLVDGSGLQGELPGALAAPLDVRLPATTGTAMLPGPTPCAAEPGQPMGTPVMDDNCGGTGCGAGNCTGSACVSLTIDPSTGAPSRLDAKRGLAQ